MEFLQTAFSLPSYSRGYHLVTNEIIRAIDGIMKVETGMLQLFIQHTSAGLSINENADPSVRRDFEKIINHIVPENLPFLEHTFEGPDDMPAHIKSSMIGHQVLIPITSHRLNLGTWQGIYLCEFRNGRHSRNIVASVWGS